MLSKHVFISLIYGGIDEPDSKIIDVFICKLRRRLDEWGLEKAKIETVREQGYMLVDEKMNSQRFAG